MTEINKPSFALRALSLTKADVIALQMLRGVSEQQAISDLVTRGVNGKMIDARRGYNIPGWEKKSRKVAAKKFFEEIKI